MKLIDFTNFFCHLKWLPNGWPVQFSIVNSEIPCEIIQNQWSIGFEKESFSTNSTSFHKSNMVIMGQSEFPCTLTVKRRVKIIDFTRGLVVILVIGKKKKNCLECRCQNWVSLSSKLFSYSTSVDCVRK